MNQIDGVSRIVPMQFWVLFADWNGVKTDREYLAFRIGVFPTTYSPLPHRGEKLLGRVVPDPLLEIRVDGFCIELESAYPIRDVESHVYGPHRRRQ